MWLSNTKSNLLSKEPSVIADTNVYTYHQVFDGYVLISFPPLHIKTVKYLLFVYCKEVQAQKKTKDKYPQSMIWPHHVSPWEWLWSG